MPKVMASDSGSVPASVAVVSDRGFSTLLTSVSVTAIATAVVPASPSSDGASFVRGVKVSVLVADDADCPACFASSVSVRVSPLVVGSSSVLENLASRATCSATSTVASPETTRTSSM